MAEDPKKVHAPAVEDKHEAFVRLVDKLPANERAAALVNAQHEAFPLFVLRHRITDIGRGSALVKRVGLIWTLESPDGNRRRTVAVDGTRFDFARLDGIAPHTDLRALVAPGATIEGTRFIAELPSRLEHADETWARLSWEGSVKLALDDLWVRAEATTSGESAKPDSRIKLPWHQAAIDRARALIASDRESYMPNGKADAQLIARMMVAPGDRRKRLADDGQAPVSGARGTVLSESTVRTYIGTVRDLIER